MLSRMVGLTTMMTTLTTIKRENKNFGARPRGRVTKRLLLGSLIFYTSHTHTAPRRTGAPARTNSVSFSKAIVVGVRGFEPPAPSSRTPCSAQKPANSGYPTHADKPPQTTETTSFLLT